MASATVDGPFSNSEPKVHPHPLAGDNASKIVDILFFSGKNLVDCISTAHPSLLTKEDIDAVAVPVQIIAPEHDPALTSELKAHANSVIPTLGLEYDYQYFPGLSHGFSVRCDRSDVKQKDGQERAKNVAVAWFAQFLHLH